MAGTTTAPTAAAGSQLLSYIQQQDQQQQQFSASTVNSFSLATVFNRLATILHGRGSVNMKEFYSLCISLARHVDNELVNNEVPRMAKELPRLLEQIYRYRQNYVLQTGIMVLMVSVKNACKAGWFSDKESQVLLGIANEIASFFCSPGVLDSTANYSSISKILARFYPLMSMGKILASLEVKRGYGAYLMDFQISKSIEHSPQNTIRLFVAQTDNIETSACITSPQQVNFLLNGKSIEGRTTVLMDCGAQMPTDVTSLLKCGTNLLQAVGQFDGEYSILVAFMSVNSSASPVIEDYVQHDVATQDLDSDIFEGPSRISLNCPISHKRIKTPVKGYSCKHLQCFDFDNYVDINSRRPSWRCPHCNHSVCYADIRLDENMVKVLREVGDSVVDIMISADGSWNSVFENDNPVNQTLDDNVMDEIMETESDDRKPAIDQLSNNEVGVNHSAVLPSVSTTGNLSSPFVSRDPIFPVLNSGMQNQLSAAFMQFHSQFTNPALNHEYRRFAAVPQNPVTSSTTIPAFPAPSWTPSMQMLVQPPQQIMRSNLCIPVPNNGSSVATRAPFTSISLNPTSSQQHPPPIQNWSQDQVRSALLGAYRVGGPSTPVQRIPVQGGRPWTPLQQCDTQFGMSQTAGSGNSQHNSYTYAHRQPMARPFPSASISAQTSSIGPSRSHPVNSYVVIPVEQSGNTGGAVPTDKNCMTPAGRMRGSLSGRNCSPSISQLIIQPTQSNQPTQPVRPQSNLSSTAPMIVPSLEALLSKTMADNPPQSTQSNLSSTAPMIVPSLEALLSKTMADNPPQSTQSNLSSTAPTIVPSLEALLSKTRADNSQSNN